MRPTAQEGTATGIETIPVPALAGLTGWLRVDIGSEVACMIGISDGVVTVKPGDGEADAVAICDSEETAVALRRGEINPIVAILQGRLSLRGDPAFATKVILGLRTMTPSVRGPGARAD
jgi:putative sterol carrier protein